MFNQKQTENVSRRKTGNKRAVASAKCFKVFFKIWETTELLCKPRLIFIRIICSLNQAGKNYLVVISLNLRFLSSAYDFISFILSEWIYKRMRWYHSLWSTTALTTTVTTTTTTTATTTTSPTTTTNNNNKQQQQYRYHQLYITTWNLAFEQSDKGFNKPSKQTASSLKFDDESKDQQWLPTSILLSS